MENVSSKYYGGRMEIESSDDIILIGDPFDPNPLPHDKPKPNWKWWEEYD